MKRETKLVLGSLTVLALAVPAILVWASFTQRFIFSRSLHVMDFVESDRNYTADVSDAEQDVAHISIRLGNPLPSSNRIPILFSLWHTDNTELDSLTLQFTTQPHVTSVFLEASSYVWPHMVFHQDGAGVLFSVDDVGWYGEATITLTFILDPDSHSDMLGLSIDFSMHYTSFLSLTAVRGHTDLFSPL